MTIIQNSIESFSAGDTLIFEASEASESYVAWPEFSNTESILDLDAYKVSYQRKGDSIVELPSVSVDNYKWRGYSTLVLNTSSKSGQKLEYNHLLKLYDNEARTEPIAIIRGDSEKDITFQLKYPVENKSGTFIDVSTLDILGESILNKLYVFIPYTNTDLYVYDTNNFRTYLYFNSIQDEETEKYSPQTIKLPIGLPSGNYLLGMNMKDDINLTIDYINLINDSSFDINCPATSSDEAQGNMKYTFDPNFKNYLRSYVDDKAVFTDDKYDYIELVIDSDYKKVKLPSLITYNLNKSPYKLDWYYKIDNEYKKVDSTFSNVGSALLEEIDFENYSEEQISELNPKNEGLYELIQLSQASKKNIRQDLTEHCGHLAIVILGDSNPLVQRLLDALERNDLYQEIIKQNPNFAAHRFQDNDLKAVAGWLVGNQFNQSIDKASNPNNPVNKVLKTLGNLLNRIIDAVKVKLKKIPSREYAASLRQVNDIAAQIAQGFTSPEFNGMAEDAIANAESTYLKDTINTPNVSTNIRVTKQVLDDLHRYVKSVRFYNDKLYKQLQKDLA